MTDPGSESVGIEWWTALTAHGGEGMVVKLIDVIVRGGKRLAQPAMNCRGPEYGACMNACLECWRWKVSQWIRGYDAAAAGG